MKTDSPLYKKHKVLDKGFIRAVDILGEDTSIVQAARVSYGSGTKQVSQDKDLLNYLMRHYHNTPFEMASIKLHVKCPIFVARQWMRHRTWSYNEVSARYSNVSDEFYIPDKSRVKLQSKANKQQSSQDNLDHEMVDFYIEDVQQICNNSLSKYAFWSKDQNVARELARVHMPQNIYTEFYAYVNCHNLLNFLYQRTSNNAQYEIREYANIINDVLLKEWLPLVYIAFQTYRKNAINLTEYDIESIKRIMQGQGIGYFPSKREVNEFKGKIERLGITLTET